MWHWDQGHLAYFQFDALRKIAAFVVDHEFKNASRNELLTATDLDFQAPMTHSPWRQYSRALKLSLLVSEIDGEAKATEVAKVLAEPGAVTCDEYLYFLVRAFTEPAPALEDWTPKAHFRYPLLFSLKYLLAKTSMGELPVASLSEIIGAYIATGFSGEESDSDFIKAVGKSSSYSAKATGVDARQARESLKVMAQISFLSIRKGNVIVSLDKEDAKAIFGDLSPIAGSRAASPGAEIRRLAMFFKAGSTSDVFDYPNTIVSDAVESGFREGSKVKKTHIVIERNASLRKEYFALKPTDVCDVCTMHTGKSYPWTASGVIDLHHLLPLASGTRVEKNSTTIDDLVPVCPTCHRAIHRYYDGWLKQKKQKDFTDGREARGVYKLLKSEFPGIKYA
jgi:hypothetical protein